MSKSLDDILRNKGDLKPRQVEKIFNANGWYIVRTNNHNIYKKEGRSELVIAPTGKHFVILARDAVWQCKGNCGMMKIV